MYSASLSVFLFHAPALSLPYPCRVVSVCPSCVLWAGAAHAQCVLGVKGLTCLFPPEKLFLLNCQFYCIQNEEGANIAVPVRQLKYKWEIGVWCE